MKANRKLLELAMAKAQLTTRELACQAEMPRPTVNNVITGRSVRPATLGKIACALGVNVEDILEREKEV